jgi:C-terminal processing protease CtpA/Prc
MLSFVVGMTLACVLFSARAEDGQYGSLDFSRMTKDQVDYFWRRLDRLAFEEAVLSYCGQADDFEKRASEAIKSCVTEDALRKADAYFRAKMKARIGQLGERKLSCKAKDAVASVHGWLGVELEPVNASFADSLGVKAASGALVARTIADSPAEAAGVKTGDVITSLDGAAVADPKELIRRVALVAPQTTAVIGVLRDGAAQTISVKVGSIATDAQGKVALDGPVLISESRNDLSYVATEVGKMCSECKTSVWAMFCR